MTNEEIKELWNKAITEIDSGTSIFQTVKLNGAHDKWFSVSVDSNFISISESEKKPSSILTKKRNISKTEFIETASHYENWKRKIEKRSFIVHELGYKNVSYIFGIVSFLLSDS